MNSMKPWILRSYYLFLAGTFVLFAFYPIILRMNLARYGFPRFLMHFTESYHKGLASWSFFTPSNLSVTVGVVEKGKKEKNLEIPGSRNYFTVTQYRLTYLPIDIVRNHPENAPILCAFYELPRSSPFTLHLVIRKNGTVKEQNLPLICRGRK